LRQERESQTLQQEREVMKKKDEALKAEKGRERRERKNEAEKKGGGDIGRQRVATAVRDVVTGRGAVKTNPDAGMSLLSKFDVGCEEAAICRLSGVDVSSKRRGS
jgi:hypothetical protein